MPRKRWTAAPAGIGSSADKGAAGIGTAPRSGPPAALRLGRWLSAVSAWCSCHRSG